MLQNNEVAYAEGSRRRNSQFCRAETAEPAPTEIATALEADQRNISVSPITANSITREAPVGPGGVGIKELAAPARPTTIDVNRMSPRLRSAIQRKRTFEPRPLRTAANKPLSKGSWIAAETSESRLTT